MTMFLNQHLINCFPGNLDEYSEERNRAAYEMKSLGDNAKVCVGETNKYGIGKPTHWSEAYNRPQIT